MKKIWGVFLGLVLIALIILNIFILAQNNNFVSREELIQILKYSSSEGVLATHDVSCDIKCAEWKEDSQCIFVQVQSNHPDSPSELIPCSDIPTDADSFGNNIGYSCHCISYSHLESLGLI